jgi:hypothetical protein
LGIKSITEGFSLYVMPNEDANSMYLQIFIAADLRSARTPLGVFMPPLVRAVGVQRSVGTPLAKILESDVLHCV